jgi:hypothetical protein
MAAIIKADLGDPRRDGVGRIRSPRRGAPISALLDREGRRAEPRRTRAEELHAQAQKWQRLARETLYPAVSEALIELASDYEHLAERLSSRKGKRANEEENVSH